MEKTITKSCYKNCLFAENNICLLSKCIQNSSLAEIKTKKINKHKPYKSNKHILPKKKNIRKNARSFFYGISKETFYKIGYYSSSIKEAAEKLGTSASHLKWFLYSDIITYNQEKKEGRIERICAFLDGQNDAKKDKLRLNNE